MLNVFPQCDEHRPRCVNCQTAGLKCAFTSDASPRSGTASGPATSYSSASEISTPVHQSLEVDLPRSVPVFALSEPPDPGLNMEHLELLHHFCTITYKTFTPDEPQQEIWRGTVVRMGFAFPFLMYELLAIGALHIAYCRTEHAQLYYTKSTELQSLAVNTFNTIQRDIDASNCAPVLIFTSLLALHILADPSRTVGLDSNQYLDHVMGCIMLMRNVQKLVISEWEAYLKETELKPLFHLQQPSMPYDIPQPCLDLADLSKNSDLSQEAREAYDAAIERLQWIFALSKVPLEKHNTVRWLLAWPIQIGEGYLELLNQQRPEALVILAYYAVLMQFYRDCWAVGDSGQFLVRAIHSHLGPRWVSWMKWPISFLQTSED